MRRAVDAFETSEYWTRRAAAALHHAKYLERSDVRQRRIKTLEADLKRCKAHFTPDSKVDGAKYGCPESVWCGQTRGGHWVEKSKLPELEAYYMPWIQHIENRLAYERAMLNEQGGTATDKFNLEIGGQVKSRGEWSVILKINKKIGTITSVQTTRRYCSKVSVDEITDYKAPAEGDTAKVMAATDFPACNYPGMIAIVNHWTNEIEKPQEAKEMTKAEWKALHTDYKCYRHVRATETHGQHKVRVTYRHGWNGPVFITDEKRKDPPTVSAKPEPIILPTVEREVRTYKPPEENPEAAKFEAMKDSLKGGIQTVTAPQLFPTPPDVAARMVELAEIEPGMTILEPSAGTGNILEAIYDNGEALPIAIEINQQLVDRLKIKYPLMHCHCFDFLAFDRSKHPVDRIIMNPPFENGSDIKHIQHALTMLKPGGKLVAICAGGPRQEAALKPLADTWKKLPEGTFKNQGTNVSTVLLTITKA
jgi:phospholipid N-methyltransferase